MNTGYTKDLPQSERDENELRAIVEILQSDPTNEYWRSRFEGAPHPVEEAYRIEQELTPNFDDDMTDYLDLKATQEDARLS